MSYSVTSLLIIEFVDVLQSGRVGTGPGGSLVNTLEKYSASTSAFFFVCFQPEQSSCQPDPSAGFQFLPLFLF